MDKKAIWITIGLMAAALVGSVLLQLYWINWSVELNRQQFNNNVYAAINNMARTIEQIDNDKMLNDLPRATYEAFYVTSSYRDANGAVASEVVIERTTTLTKEEVVEQFHNEQATQCNCLDCEKERRDIAVKQMDALKKKKIYRDAGMNSIDEHLPELHVIKKLIEKELEAQGIRMEFKYGVYSNKQGGFVLKDGHYLINDFGTQGIAMGDNQLLSTNYKIDLFSNGINSPGFLAIYFPNLTSTIWKSAWKTMLAALIFTGIILFCFAYTIHVIFFQKKLGEMKTDFINNMTHEFKTPIATISLAADSITSPMISGNVAKVNRFADIIKQENKRMLSQVEKVLQMAQLDKENFNLNITEIDLHEVIRRAVKHTNLQVEKKGGLITADLNADKTFFQGDMTHISNIIHNLLDNANKYSPNEPQIKVTTRNYPNGIEMTVKDNGIGMSKEALKHIFDKFFRVHTGNLHDVKGFGLGLSYVKAMVTAHRGSIDVKSELGKGSSFIMFFPFKHKE